MTDPHMREAVAHLPTPEELAEMAEEEAAHRALLPRNVDPIPVRARFYLTKCEHCGWVGSSESCGLCLGWDDADVVCPACDQFIGALDPGKADEARHGDAVMARIEAAEALTLLLARALGETLNERNAALADLGRVRSDLRAALCEISAQARARGEAEGRLRMSEMAGIVEGWHARAKAAEVRIAELEGVIQMVIQDADEHMRRVGIRPALLCPKAEALARALLSTPASHPRGGENAR